MRKSFLDLQLTKFLGNFFGKPIMPINIASTWQRSLALFFFLELSHRQNLKHFTK